MNRIERSVRTVETGWVHDHILIWSVVTEAVSESEVMDSLVKVRIMVRLHKILEHDLPVPWIRFNLQARQTDHVRDVVVSHLSIKLHQRRCERQRVLVVMAKYKSLP